MFKEMTSDSVFKKRVHKMSKAKPISKTASEKKTKPIPSKGVAKEKAKISAKVTASKVGTPKASAPKMSEEKVAKSKPKAMPEEKAKPKAKGKVTGEKKAVSEKKAPVEKKTTGEKKAVVGKKAVSEKKAPVEKKSAPEKKVEKKGEKKSKPKSASINKAKAKAPSKPVSEEKAKAKTKIAAPKSKAKPAKAKTTKEAPKAIKEAPKAKAKSPAKKKSKGGSKTVAPKTPPAKTTAATDKKPTKTTSKKSSTSAKKKTKKATKVESGKGGSVASEPEASGKATPKKSTPQKKATKKKAEQPKSKKTTVKKSSAKSKGVKKKARAKKVALASVELEDTAPEIVADEPLPKEQTEEFRTSLKGSYKFSVPAMLALLDLFAKRSKLTDEEGMKIVGVETAKRYNEYRNFLFTGDFIDRGGKSFIKTEKLDQLWEALRTLDYRTIADYLNQVPSFLSFLGNLKVGTPSLLKDIPSISKSAYPTYCTLAEIAGVALNIADEGIYLTNHYPSVEDFAKMALESYDSAQTKGEKTVLTGLWLETLAKKHGVHPMVSRQLLQQAQQEELLKVTFEGTTSPTQFRKHIMYYLDLEKGVPTLQQLNLYNGDFVTPNRTSVQIRFEDETK